MNSILLVDDSLTVMMQLERFANNKIPEVIILKARDANQALSLVDESKPNLLLAIVDYHIPGMDGIQLVERLSPHINPSKIVVLTADLQDSVLEDVKSKGANFVPKPLTQGGFDKLIDELVSGK